jgi:hypothetical protein
MFSSISVIFPSAISVIAKLTDEFAHWKSPLMILILQLSCLRLLTDPISPDLKGELNLKI